MNDVQPFDPTDILVADHQSPGLEEIKPNYESAETPPPVLTQDSSTELSDSEDEVGPAPKRRRGRRKKGCQSEYGVLSQLDPTSNDPARHALKYALDSATPSEVDQEEERQAHVNGDSMVIDRPMSATVVSTDAAVKMTQRLKATTGEEDDNFDPLDMLADGHHEDYRAQVLRTNGVHKAYGDGESRSVEASDNLPPVQKQLDYKPPPLRPITTGTPRSVSDWEGSVDEAKATSPGLIQFTINAANASEPGNTLPAMQMSPPRSPGQVSVEHKTLPSITTALSIDSNSPFSAHSPDLSRPTLSHIGHQYGPSSPAYLHSSMSPPTGVPSHPSFYRNPLNRDGSTSTPSDYAITSTNGSSSTPASSITTQSPSSYPTPTTAHSDTQLNSISQLSRHLSLSTPTSPAHDQTQYPCSSHSNSNTHPSLSSSDHSTNSDDYNTPGSFKCTIPGCTAIPFQTQYLLNSHMNVHSDTRPHFCPVKNCARGPGGQGFKRKNEMIRYIPPPP